MDISMHMNLKVGQRFPVSYKERSMQKGVDLKTITCIAKKLSIQKEKVNLYQVLSLSSEKAGFEEIKKAYRSMALQFHPDVCPPSAKEENTRRFVELRRTYDTLSYPVSRSIYDGELGLIDSVGCLGKVWERQLGGLRKRSGDRMERKNNEFM